MDYEKTIRMLDEMIEECGRNIEPFFGTRVDPDKESQLGMLLETIGTLTQTGFIASVNVEAENTCPDATVTVELPLLAIYGTGTESGCLFTDLFLYADAFMFAFNPENMAVEVSYVVTAYWIQDGAPQDVTVSDICC